jgi:MFS transporter, OFA family, oxalate/formate antiporter
MDFKKKRWISLYAGFFIELLAGNGYAWSVYQTPLIEKYGWTISQLTSAYTTSFITGMFISLLLGAKLKRMFKTRTEVFLGILCYAGATLLLSQMTGQIWQLFLIQGFLNSLGISMVYPVLIAYSQELFPERPGFAGGVMTAGFGLGAVIWAPLATKIYTTTGDISFSFLYLGFVFLIGMTGLSVFLKDPPENFRERMIQEAGALVNTGKQKARALVYDINKAEMIRTPMFWMLMVSMILGLACGGMIVNQGSPIVQLKFGMAATAAASVVSILAVGNTIGRFLWGYISDRIGKAETVRILHVFQAVFMLMLLFLNNKVLFIIGLMGSTFCYGGLACMLAPLTGELFGTKNIGANYSVAYAAYGLSALVGPNVIAIIRQATGEYTYGYVFAVAFSVIAFFVTVFIIKKANKIRELGINK